MMSSVPLQESFLNLGIILLQCVPLHEEVPSVPYYVMLLRLKAGAPVQAVTLAADFVAPNELSVIDQTI